MSLEIVIWLEVHLKVNSPTKLFCACKNEQDFDDLAANTHICPTCTGQPGALPVLQKWALAKAVQLWLALWCEIQQESSFDRKSYFYPDLVMWYQITQQYAPTNINGEVSFFVDNEFTVSKSVRIRDAHIEIDTWKTTQLEQGRLLDYNRSGTPLIEIVTQPDFTTSEEVVAFLKELQRLARYNDLSDGDMDKGQMRVDVNISLRPEWQEEYGTRTEMKNMNSYSQIIKAIEVEVARQAAILDTWWEIEQETRGRDDPSKTSYVMRCKEDAMDYRYMPEPDLPPVLITSSRIDEIKSTVVESPYARIMRYQKNYTFNKEYINWLISDADVNMFFEQTLADGFEPKLTATWIVWPIARWLNEAQVSIQKLPFSREYYIEFLSLLRDGKISNQQAKEVMKEMIWTGKKPVDIVEEKWYKPVSREEIQAWIDEILESKPELKTQLESGDMKPLWFLTGQVMKKSGWSADPKMVKDIILSQ